MATKKIKPLRKKQQMDQVEFNARVYVILELLAASRIDEAKEHLTTLALEF